MRTNIRTGFEDGVLTDTPKSASLASARNNHGRRNARLSLESLKDTPDQRQKDTKTRRRKRLRPAAVRSDDGDERSESNKSPRKAKDRVKQRMVDKYSNPFLDLEAANDDESDSEDEEGLDDESSYGGFINDTSQLGYTQDDLDRANPDESIDDFGNDIESATDALHRQFDHQTNVAEQFKTPVLNRRMGAPSPGGLDTQSSQKGLGNMNFVKSVLEHHRRGGDADEIENAYNELAGCEESDMDSPVGEPSSIGHHERSSEAAAVEVQQRRAPSAPSWGPSPDDGRGGAAPRQRQPHAASSGPQLSNNATAEPPRERSVLTAEQRARIEFNREAARRKRMQAQSQTGPVNPYAKKKW